MDLLDLKRWHWMLIGLIAGGLWSASRLFYGFDLPNEGGPITLQQNFSWLLIATERAPAIVLDEGSNVYLSDLEVHPPVPDFVPGAKSTSQPGAASLVQWVSGTLHRHRFRQPMTAWTTTPFRYKAPLPYVPNPVYDAITQDWIMSGRAKAVAGYQKPQQKSYVTVQDYLKEIHRKYGPAVIPYRYCWWETRLAILTIYPLGGLLAVGVIWPAILALLTATGLAAKKAPDDYDLSRFGSSAARRASAAVKANGPTAADDARLAAVTAEYEQGLRPSADRSSGAVPSPANPAAHAVRKLTGAAESAAAPAPRGQTPAKSYGADAGDYYPTEIHHKPADED